METFLSTILLWGCNFAPNNWAFCYGQLLSISQNTALFSLLGTYFGGDGVTTFALPDFQGRVPIGAGNGLGLSPYILGQKGGTENVSLLLNNLPSHTHTVSLSVTINASGAPATSSAPLAGYSLAAANDPVSGDAVNVYASQTPNIALNTAGTASGNTGPAGSNLPHTNIQPYLAVNYIIALQGIYPSRG